MTFAWDAPEQGGAFDPESGMTLNAQGQWVAPNLKRKGGKYFAPSDGAPDELRQFPAYAPYVDQALKSGDLVQDESGQWHASTDLSDKLSSVMKRSNDPIGKFLDNGGGFWGLAGAAGALIGAGGLAGYSPEVAAGAPMTVPSSYWSTLAEGAGTASDAAPAAAGSFGPAAGDFSLTTPGAGIGGVGTASTGLTIPSTAGMAGEYSLAGLGAGGAGLGATTAGGVPLSSLATGIGGVGAGTAALGGAVSGGGSNLVSDIAKWLTPSTGISGLQSLGLLTSGVGAIGSALASKSAANTAADASNRATDAQLGMFNTINAQQLPYRVAGYSSLGSMLGGLGLGPASGGVGAGQFTHQFNADDLKTNLAPNYQFMRDQGLGAVTNAANRTGGLAGNTLKGVNDYAMNYADNAYQSAFNNYNANQTNIFNRLSNIAGLGQTANQSTANAGTAISGNAANTMVGAGQAQAAGTIGAANALTQGANNAMGWYSLPALLNWSNGSANA